MIVASLELVLRLRKHFRFLFSFFYSQAFQIFICLSFIINQAFQIFICLSFILKYFRFLFAFFYSQAFQIFIFLFLSLYHSPRGAATPSSPKDRRQQESRLTLTPSSFPRRTRATWRRSPPRPRGPPRVASPLPPRPAAPPPSRPRRPPRRRPREGRSRGGKAGRAGRRPCGRRSSSTRGASGGLLRRIPVGNPRRSLVKPPVKPRGRVRRRSGTLQEPWPRVAKVLRARVVKGYCVAVRLARPCRMFRF